MESRNLFLVVLEAGKFQVGDSVSSGVLLSGILLGLQIVKGGQVPCAFFLCTLSPFGILGVANSLSHRLHSSSPQSYALFL